MLPSSYCEELPLNTLDMQELLMQFKVMKALGYHSLFDADFRRELRNPFRKILYYRLISAEESTDAQMYGRFLKGAADRIGFYSNPELAKHIREREEQAQLRDPNTAKTVIDEQRSKYEEASKRYTPPDEVTLKAIQDTLRK